MRPLIPQDPERIGRYRLTHRLGTGGMGQVYLARTPSGIQIVVKVVRAGLLEDAELTEGGTDYRERFAREADLASRVGGFYTAEVVDCDPRADRPWIAYAYIRGLSLKEFLQLKGPLDPPSLRALAAGLGEGLQAIHGNGLIHRDLKPSNVILSEDGPRIIDFGVARPTQGSSMTGTGHVFGTLPYMSPEQAEGTPLSPGSDLFALGTTLAHAATGDSPFDTSSNPRTLMRLVGPPPVHLLTALPEDLRSLISACWNHDPEQRPLPRQVIHRCTSAGLDRTWPPRDGDQNVPATLPPPAPPKPPGQGPRRGVLLALAGSVMALLVGITVWLVASASGDDGGLAVPPYQDPTGPEPAAPDTDPANIRWAGEWSGGQPTGVLGDTGGANLWPLAVSPDGTLVAVGDGVDNDVEIHLWETGTGIQRASLEGHGLRLRDLAFSPDGSLLASASWDGTVRVWDVADGTEVVDPITTHTAQVRTVAFDPTGSLLATGADDGYVHLWDAEDFSHERPLEHDHGVLKVAFSPDGNTIATSSSPGTDEPGDVGEILLWDVDSQERPQEYPLPIPEGADYESARALSFDTDGGLLAAAGAGGVIHLWDVDDPSSHEMLPLLDEQGENPERPTTTQELAFSPDGTTMATVGSDVLVRVWDVDERTELHQLTRHTAFTRGAAFSPDGATLYTSADDGTVRIAPAPS